MSHRWEWVKSHKYLSGFGALLVLIGVLFGLSTFYFQGSIVGGSDNMISYCGNPEFFDQFGEQYGYLPNSACTGVVIDDYRIDTEKESGYTWGGDWSWGCAGSVSVYRIKDNGELEEIRDTGEVKPELEDFQVGDLTIEPISQTSGLSFYNCEWVANTYEYDFDGNLSMQASAPEEVSDRDSIPVELRLSNQYGNRITGDVTATFCTEGAFGMNRCISRSAEVDLLPGGEVVKTVQVPKENVGEVIEVSASFNGVMNVDGWERVNLDCDRDGTVERIEDCDGFPVSLSKDLDSIRTIPPVEVRDIIGPRTAAVGENVTYTANVSNLEEVSPSLSWNNGDTGESAVYSWNSTGNHTVELTIDDGISEKTESIEVRVEEKGLFGGIFSGVLDFLTFWG